MTKELAKGRGWRRAPEVGTVLGLRFIVMLCNLFGRRVASGFLWSLSVYYALFHFRARRASRSYLTRVGISPTLHAVITHFWHFARVSTDRYLFLSGRSTELEVHHHGNEHVLRLAGLSEEGLRAERTETSHSLRSVSSPEPPTAPDAAPRRGAVLLGAHLGSFEAMRALATEKQVPLSVVVDFRQAQRINGVLARFNPNMKVHMIGLDPGRPTSMLDVKQCIDKGELVAILGDRPPERGDRTVQVEFMGGQASFPSGPFLLAHMLHCPVYLVFGLFTAPNRYDLYCEQFSEMIHLPRATREESLRKHVQAYAAALETRAKSAPYNWFNFFEFWS